MSNRRLSGRRIASVIVIVVVVTLLLLYVGYPMVLAITALSPDGDTAPEAPDGFLPVALMTDDGVHLAAWYAAPQNGAAIIVAHGAGGGRGSIRAYAAMLRDNGFGVLAVSLRGFDDSAGRINRLGWRGTLDIGAAIDYLADREDVKAIGALGLSMGGEVLLGAASAYPTMRAIAAEGATYRNVSDYQALPENRPLYRYFTQAVFSLMVRLFSGEDRPDPSLLGSLQAAQATSFLFIAAGNNDVEIAYNTLFQAATGDRGSLWVIPNVNHTGGFDSDPHAYEQRVVAFFKRVLLETPAN